ncbi:MAG: hypothetical protein NT069_24355 [Planctomycetota bacterium]|nr:hypothetical protein [Planctomycetota bacterium]
MALAFLMLVGCQDLRQFMSRNRSEFGPGAPCVLAQHASAPEIIAHVNNNAASIRSWQTHNASISSPGIPFSVTASIVVEAPRNFRMVARSPLGPEVDLGSNAEHYWFWSRDDKSKRIYLANHETESGQPLNASMPFQPEWIMEAMGVIPLDPTRVVEVNRDPQAGTVTLSEDRVSPQGQPLRKVTVVNLCHGLVTEHALVDGQGRLIARAQLLNHVRDPASRAVLPAKIHLVWPVAKIDMVMALGTIEVNAGAIRRSTFTVQKYNGCEVFQVGGEDGAAIGNGGGLNGLPTDSYEEVDAN